MKNKTKLLTFAVAMMFIGTAIIIVNEMTDETEATTATIHQPYVGNFYLSNDGTVTWTEPNDPELTGISFDKNTNTLVLDHAIFIVSGEHMISGDVDGIWSELNLNIRIIGFNTIRFEGALNTYYCYLICAYNNLSLSGENPSKDVLRTVIDGTKITKNYTVLEGIFCFERLTMKDCSIQLSINNTSCTDDMFYECFGIYCSGGLDCTNCKIKIDFEDAASMNNNNYFSSFSIYNESCFSDSSVSIRLGKSNSSEYRSYAMYTEGNNVTYDNTSLDIYVANPSDGMKGVAIGGNEAFDEGPVPLSCFTKVKTIQGSTSIDGKLTEITGESIGNEYCRLLVQVEDTTTQNIMVGILAVIGGMSVIFIAAFAIKP